MTQRLAAGLLVGAVVASLAWSVRGMDLPNAAVLGVVVAALWALVHGSWWYVPGFETLAQRFRSIELVEVVEDPWEAEAQWDELEPRPQRQAEPTAAQPTAARPPAPARAHAPVDAGADQPQPEPRGGAFRRARRRTGAAGRRTGAAVAAGGRRIMAALGTAGRWLDPRLRRVDNAAAAGLGRVATRIGEAWRRAAPHLRRAGHSTASGVRSTADRVRTAASDSAAAVAAASDIAAPGDPVPLVPPGGPTRQRSDGTLAARFRSAAGHLPVDERTTARLGTGLVAGLVAAGVAAVLTELPLGLLVLFAAIAGIAVAGVPMRVLVFLRLAEPPRSRDAS